MFKGKTREFGRLGEARLWITQESGLYPVLRQWETMDAFCAQSKIWFKIISNPMASMCRMNWICKATEGQRMAYETTAII